MKGDKMSRRSSFGTMMRRRLSDITNSLPQPKSPSILEKLPPDNVSVRDYIDHLLKEKMALVKHIQEKNKIIELSGIEIQNLRTCLQKMKIQNWALAQTNSQMLGELNMGKEKLKALQHEIACKAVLLKTKNLELKEKEEAMNVQKTQFQEAVVETNNEDTRRRPLSRSRSLGSSTVSQQHTEKDAAASKRRCLRRQSTSSRSRCDEPTDNLFEIDEAKFPEDGNSIVELEVGGRRRSVSRPSRRAAEKVQSYKERPINIKMRRPE